MKGLRHIVTPKATVALTDGQEFEVTGLSPSHIFGLYHRHRGQLASLFDRLAADGNVSIENAGQIAESLLSSAPLILAEIVALASGSHPFDETPVDPAVPDGATVWQADVNLAASLPVSVQADALQKIGDLTFTADMPPKKFLSVLARMIQSANLTNLSLSSSSTGTSEDK